MSKEEEEKELKEEQKRQGREVERAKREFNRWIEETIIPMIEAQAERLKKDLPRAVVRPYIRTIKRQHEHTDLVSAFGENFQMLNLFLGGLSNRKKHELFIDLRALLVRYLSLSKDLPRFSPRLSMEPLPYEEMPVLESFEDILALIDDQLYNLIQIAERRGLENKNCPKN